MSTPVGAAAEEAVPSAPASLLWAVRHPVAAHLEGALPAPRMIEHLEALVPADLDDPTLLEVVAAWERVGAWVAARQSLAIRELSRRASGAAVEHVADDVAVRLGASRRVGQDLVTLAAGLDAFPAVQDALGSGALDVRKARVLLVETEHLPDHHAAAIHEAVLPDADRLSAPQLRLAVRRAEATLDPAANAARHEAARRDRCVRMVPAPEAMAWIHALLPAPDAATVMGSLDALAAAAAPEDVRRADERRADALTDLCRRILDTGLGPDGTPLPTSQHRRPHLHLTLNAAAAAALVAGPAGRTGAPGPTGAAGSTPLLPAVVADLAGYGPVPLAAVADLLPQATWRALLTDPSTGAVTARGARAYRPSPALAALVVDRDVTCTFPGCRIPAARCDLDHVDAFDPGSDEAQTIAENLHALCRHHHRLKTAGIWRPTRDVATGVTTWVSPTGHTYTRDPVPADPEHWSVPRRPPRPTVHPDPGSGRVRPEPVDVPGPRAASRAHRARGPEAVGDPGPGPTGSPPF